MAICRDEFREALRNWASGVSVVTTKDNSGNLHGITVSAFASVSLEPPLVLICIDKFTASHYAFPESRRFVVNILSSEQEPLSRRFATPLLDKFGSLDFYETAEGVPILKDTLASLECSLVSSHESGDHTIFVGEIEKAVVREGKPLLYFQGNYADLQTRRG